MSLTDRREIEFDAEALIATIASSLQAAGALGLPPIPPKGARFHPADDEVAFIYGDGQSQRAVRLKATAIGALLIPTAFARNSDAQERRQKRPDGKRRHHPGVSP